MMQRVQTEDGTSIAFDVSGEGPTLLFIHGLGDERGVWGGVIAHLAARYRCVALDLRGHGQSADAADYELFRFVQDVRAVLAAGEGPPAVLVGHSLGGFLASMAATEVPVRGVVSVDQPLDLQTLGAALRALRSAIAEERVATVLMNVLEQIGLGALSEEQTSRLVQSRSRLSRDVLWGVWGRLLDDDVTLQQTIDARVANLSCPFLSLHTCGTPPDYEVWLRRIPQAQLEHWSGLGHFPHLEASAAFAARLESWLHGVAS